MFLTRKSLRSAPPFIREEIDKLNARYTSDQVKDLDTRCCELVADLRARQKDYDARIRRHLAQLDATLIHLEETCYALKTCVTVLHGHEKIIENRMKDLQAACEAGDETRMADAESRLAKTTQSYKSTMKKASRISARIESDLEQIDRHFATLRDAGGNIPAPSLDADVFLQA